MAVPAVLPREAAYWAGGALIAPPPEVHGDTETITKQHVILLPVVTVPGAVP